MLLHFLFFLSAPSLGFASEFPYLDSIRDGIQAKAAYSARSSGSVVQLAEPKFRTNKIEVALHAQKEAADLVVFLPGMQQGYNHDYSKIIVYLAGRLRLHTLVIPAAFSDDYRAQKPRDVPGSLPQEAEVVANTIQNAVEKIGRARVKSIKIVGLSYGGFLGAMVATQAERLALPVSLHLISPPSNMGDIAFRLDTLMDRNLIPFDPTYGMKDVLWAARPQFSGQAAEEGAAKAFAWVFYNDQKAIIAYLQTEFGCLWRPTPDQVRFWPTVENCSPQNAPFLRSERAQLGYWVEKIPKTIKIHSMISHLDPFSNFDSLAPGLKQRLSIWEIPVSAGSGHNGFLTTSEFQERLVRDLRDF